MSFSSLLWRVGTSKRRNEERHNGRVGILVVAVVEVSARQTRNGGTGGSAATLPSGRANAGPVGIAFGIDLAASVLATELTCQSWQRRAGRWSYVGGEEMG